MFGYEHFCIRREQRMISFRQNGGLTKGPAKIGIAHLSTAESFDFTGGCNGAFNKPAVTDKILHRREALNSIDLEKNGQRQHPANAGNGFDQGEIPAENPTGLLCESLLNKFNAIVIGADQVHIAFDRQRMKRI